MSILSMLIPGLLASAPRTSYVNTGNAAGGASELYGTCKPVVWRVATELKSFTVPDIVKATGLNRVRVNRVLWRLSAEGKVIAKEKSVNRYTQPTIWEVVQRDC